MASPVQLLQTLSDVTGIPLPSLVDTDRRLVKAGLRSRGGRGFNVARMTTRDAAHLLTAILGSAQANHSAEAVSRYAATQVDRTRSSGGLFAGSQLNDLASLKPSHSFVDGLAALIGSATAGSLAELARADSPHPPHLEIIALTRATHGRIRLTGLPNGMTASLEYVSKAHRPQSSGAHDGDLEQSRRCTARTIFAIAKLLTEEEGPHDPD